MTEPNDGMKCQLTCWGLAALVGFLTLVMLVVLADYTWTGAIFMAGVAFAVLGFLFSILFCSKLPKPGEIAAQHAGAAPTVPAREGSGAAADDVAARAAADAAAAKAAADKAAAKAAEDAAAKAADAAAQAKDAAAQTRTATANVAQSATDQVAEASSVKRSAELAGEADLAARKGSWSYEKDGEDGAGDDTVEGVAPATLDGPREGGADDLKRIKGIGPKLEKLCNSMGFYHFDQIANWTPAEVAWVNENLAGFKGRVSRDNWVEQAHLLATGGETEFSKRVDGGDVY